MKPTSLSPMKKGLALLLSGLLTTATASAATVNQTGNNTDGTTGSSFYTATMWDNAAAPSSGNNYVSDYLIRLATSGLTFAGDSLTLNPLNGGHQGSLALMFVGTGNTTVNDLRVNGGIIQVSTANSTATLNGNLTLLSGGALIKTNAENRQIVIAAKITGIGALTIESAAGTQVVTLSHAANDYTGGTILTGVNTTVKLGSALGLGSTSGSLDLSSSTATLDLNNQNQTVGALIGVTGSKITTGVAGSKILTVSNGGASSTFAGIIQNGSGTLGLTKTGAGTQTLTAANPYTGTTLVSGGTLLLSGGGAIASSATVDVGTGATLDTSGVTGGTYTF